MALLGEVGSIAMVILILYGLTSKSLVKTIILLMLLEGHYHGAGFRDKWSVNGIVTASSHNLSVPSTRTLLIDQWSIDKGNLQSQPLSNSCACQSLCSLIRE